MKHLLALILCLFALPAIAQPAGCAGEATLQGRDDILHCEPWSDANWWQNGYLDTGRKNVAEPATGPDQTSVQTNCFAGGPCLRVNCYAYNNGGCGGMLAHHWPIPGTQQEVYLRYYIRMASNWSPENYCGNVSCIPSGAIGENTTSGGKWPGLADVRTGSDPTGQCGNGGNLNGLGTNCWSARLRYRNCTGSGGADICRAGGGTNETTRLGGYLYVPPNDPTNLQDFAAFDNQSWDTDLHNVGSTCSASSNNHGSTGTDPDGNQSVQDGYDATSCGKGLAGLKNSTWYRVEVRVKMNTVGSADGVYEAWIAEVSSDGLTDVGVLKYRKTNMVYRLAGHDNLHVRTVWLDVHMGGEFNGPLTDSYIELARMVVATDYIGGFKPTGDWVSDPFTVNVN